MLAIHLNRDILSEGFKLNKQTHLVPVLATAVKQAVNKATPASSGEADASKKRKAGDEAVAKDLPKTLQVTTEQPSLLECTSEWSTAQSCIVGERAFSVCSHQGCSFGVPRPSCHMSVRA